MIALCAILLFGCSAPTCREWEIQDSLTDIPYFNSGRLILEPDSNYSRLELELVRSKSGIRLYLNLLFLKALPSHENPHQTEITILFSQKEPWIVFPYVLRGGQRLLLPGEVSDCLIEALLNGESFIIEIGRSSIKVIPDNFSSAYEELLQLPI